MQVSGDISAEDAIGEEGACQRGDADAGFVMAGADIKIFDGGMRAHDGGMVLGGVLRAQAGPVAEDGGVLECGDEGNGA